MVITGTDILNDKLFLAAEARVSGLTWEAAAKKQTMTGEELRKLAYDELPRWKELLRDAERILLRETGYEALRILRNLMRHLDPKIARDCTIAFFKINMTNVRHRMKSRPKKSEPDDFPSDEVLSYDELEPSTSPSAKSSNAAARSATTEMIQQARIDPATFLRYLLMAPGVRDPMASVHTDLQNHLSAHHGKTTQVSSRINVSASRLASIHLMRRDRGSLTFGEPIHVRCRNPECVKESSSPRQPARR